MWVGREGEGCGRGDRCGEGGRVRGVAEVTEVGVEGGEGVSSVCCDVPL